MKRITARVSRLCALTGLIGILGVPGVSLGQGQGPAPVFVAPVIEQRVAPTQSYVGTIIPERRAIVGSAVDGRVTEMFARQGIRVEKNQPLAQLLTRTIELERDAADAELKMRRFESDEMQETRVEERLQKAAEARAAQAELTLAERNLNRIRQLRVTGGAATASQIESAQAEVERLQAILDQKQAAAQEAESGPRQEQKLRAEAAVEMQQAIVDKLNDQITKHTIISRFAGYVVEELSEEGQWVKRGDPVAEVVALDNVDVMVNVLETHIRFVEIGLAVPVQISALPGREFPGKVQAVVPQGDAQSRTFPVRIRVPNEFKQDVPVVKAGMLARVALPTAELKTRMMVPQDALVLGGPTRMLYVVQPDQSDPAAGVALPVPVQTGVEVGSMIEVTGELKVGQMVVVQGNERLRPGQAVKIARTLKPEDTGPSSRAVEPGSR